MFTVKQYLRKFVLNSITTMNHRQSVPVTEINNFLLDMIYHLNNTLFITIYLLDATLFIAIYHFYYT